MEQFVYTVWFCDTELQPEDQDYEWVACILIEAVNSADARAWGDHLAKRMCERNHHIKFLRSEARTCDDSIYAGTKLDELPVVRFGEEAEDDDIGW